MFSLQSTIDAAGSAVTDWFDLRQCGGQLSITIDVPAGPVGTLTIETTDAASVVDKNRLHNQSVTVPAADVSALCSVAPNLAPNGSAYVIGVNLFTAAPFIRVRYARTSGTGTLTVYVSSR